VLARAVARLPGGFAMMGLRLDAPRPVSGQVIEQLGVGDAGVIVDHHVKVLVAG
jgi:hypothetical protein